MKQKSKEHESEVAELKEEKKELTDKLDEMYKKRNDDEDTDIKRPRVSDAVLFKVYPYPRWPAEIMTHKKDDEVLVEFFRTKNW